MNWKESPIESDITEQDLDNLREAVIDLVGPHFGIMTVTREFEEDDDEWYLNFDLTIHEKPCAECIEEMA